MFTVLNELNDMATANIELTDELLDDVYKPTCKKEQFLSDTNLRTDIGRSKFEFRGAAFAFVFSVALFVFVSSTTSFTKEPLLFELFCINAFKHLPFLFRDKKIQ